MERIKEIWGYASWGKPYFAIIGSSGRKYIMDALDIYFVLVGKIISKTFVIHPAFY